jgi:hypothetical protein
MLGINPSAGKKPLVRNKDIEAKGDQLVVVVHKA